MYMNTFVILLTICSILDMALGQEMPGEDRGDISWKKYSDIDKEYFIHVGAKNYAESLAYCKSICGKLAEPKRKKEKNKLKKLAKSVTIQGLGVWIGVNDPNQDKTFTYASNGKSLEYKNWGPTEPTMEHPGEACVNMKKSYGFKWNDAFCRKEMSFVCERVENCPVNCQWASWGSWGSCSKSCGGGTQKRTRSKSVEAQNGGNECSGSYTETRSCNTNNCPECFEAGRYDGSETEGINIDNINVPDAESCQEECQKLSECKFWTYQPEPWNEQKECWRQTEKALEKLGTCKNNLCIRGPKNCPGK